MRFFDDVPLGEADSPDEEDWGRAHLWDFSALVLPCSPLALEVCREQLGCSLGISNPASAKLILPRRWASRAERWYTPEGDSCGAPPFNDELLHLVENKDLSVSLPWCMATQLEGILSILVAITSWTDQVLGAFAGLSSAASQRGLDCLGALTRANLDIMQPCEMLRLRMMMLRRQAVVRNLPNTYGDQERRQLRSSSVGPHLFDGQTLAAVEQWELESSQQSLVSQKKIAFSVFNYIQLTLKVMVRYCFCFITFEKY
ncbi:hypothetical protein E2C01_042154 [Portunus trituberculatus]|uniref:Uncharacterized protein n=1 Tax=Portunus trituberculatus TaxID=210409 RepID=A0A5B7FPF6_PORTR|nr:hypothetical protein [Portunus trituberculatus]